MHNKCVKQYFIELITTSKEKFWQVVDLQPLDGRNKKETKQ